ncbi:myb-like protein X [Rhopilema esculentum]|uniref:myb-like protein X n=1 Tax=Rhopilema esculentum TaxID=499914 RepID=UPI0031E32879
MTIGVLRIHDDRSYAGSDRKSDSTAISKEEDKVGELSAEKGRTEAPAVTEKKDRVITSNENTKKPENTASSKSKEKEEKTQQQTGHKERDFVNHRGHSSNKERGQSGTGKRRHVENKIEQPVVEHHIEKPVIKEEHSLENLHGSEEKARREHQTAQRPSMKMKREQQNHRWENEMDRDQKIVRDRGGPQRQNWTDRRNREHELDNHKTNNKVEEKPDKGTVSAEKDDIIQRDEWYNAGIEKQATEVSTRVDRGSNARSFDQGERRRGHYNRYRNNHQKNKASYTNGYERTDSEPGRNRSHGDAINKGKGPPSDESKVYQKEAGVGLSGEEKSQTNIGNLNGETKSNTANSSSLVPAVTPSQGTKTAGAKTTEENSQGEKRQDKKDPSVDTQAQKPYTHDRLPQRTRNNRGQYYRKKNYKGSDNRGDVITKNDEKDYRNEKTFDKKRTAHGVENGYSEGNSTSTRSVRLPGKTESKNEVNDKRSDANMKGKSAVSNHNSDVSGKKHDSVTSNGIKEEHGVKPAYSKKQNSTANSNKPREISYHNGTHNDDTRKVKDVNENYST